MSNEFLGGIKTSCLCAYYLCLSRASRVTKLLDLLALHWVHGSRPETCAASSLYIQQQNKHDGLENDTIQTGNHKHSPARLIRYDIHCAALSRFSLSLCVFILDLVFSALHRVGHKGLGFAMCVFCFSIRTAIATRDRLALRAARYGVVELSASLFLFELMRCDAMRI